MNTTEIVCLEKILSHLTKLIQLYEFEDTKKLLQLCDTATSVAAQLDYIRNHCDEENE